MRPVSTRFLNAVRSTHKMKAQAFIVSGHQTGVTPEGIEIPILDGDVIHNGESSIRSSLSMSTDPALWPKTANDDLVPYGNEIFIRRGIEFGERYTEWVSQGYYRIDTISQNNFPTGEIDIAGTDRMSGIVDARLPRPRQFKVGTTVKDIFESLIKDVFPDAQVEFDFDAENRQVARNQVVEEDRYQFLADLAAAYARDFYVDHRGIFVIKQRPNSETSVFDVNSGEGGVLVEMNHEITREGVYNGVVTTGEGADAVDPVVFTVVDKHKKSRTRWGGPFGKVPRFYSSPFIETTIQARAAGEKILRDSLGLPYRVDFSAIPNPALEPYDPVLIRNGDSKRIHVINSVTIPLTAEQPLKATTKEQPFVQIGIVTI